MNFSLFHHPSGDRPLMAIILLIIGVFALACQDSLVKLLTSETSFWQFQTLRSICNIGFLLFLAGISGGFMLLRPVRWKAVYLRAGFLTVCMFFFFSGAAF
ncbi:MAG: EamA/RhaT family transporter, partial [Gammaproteobacteria bacterium]|nr:EamA/RhaT family transporter [Gammaproteobacteria bacterium]